VWPLLRGFLASQTPGSVAQNNIKDVFVEQLRRADVKTTIMLLRQRIAGMSRRCSSLRMSSSTCESRSAEYGLNSIMGLELRHQLEREPRAAAARDTDLENYPSVAALAEHLQGASASRPPRCGRPDIPAANRGVPPSRCQVGWPAPMLAVAQIENLSDDAALAAVPRH